MSEGHKLTLAKAVTLAQAIGTATKDAQLMQPQSTPIQIVQGNPPQQGNPQKKPCYRCAKLGHLPASCHFKTAKCHNRHKIGHLKKTCTAGRTAKDVGQVTEDCPSLLDSESSEYTLFILNSSSSKPIQVPVITDKQQLLIEVDKGQLCR